MSSPSSFLIQLHQLKNYFLKMVARKHCLVMIIYMCHAMKSDAELTIQAAPPSPSCEQNVTITCSIPSFDGVASFIRDDSTVLLTNCISKTESCAPKKVDRYTFGATSTSIFVVISGVDKLSDSFPWKCQYYSQTVNLTLKCDSIATTTVAPSSDNTRIIVAVVAGIGACAMLSALIILIMRIKKRSYGRCLTKSVKDDLQKDEDTNSATCPTTLSTISTELHHLEVKDGLTTEHLSDDDFSSSPGQQNHFFQRKISI